LRADALPIISLQWLQARNLLSAIRARANELGAAFLFDT
jgi:hypothetical protein